VFGWVIRGAAVGGLAAALVGGSAGFALALVLGFLLVVSRA
jgi:outer membrane lipoprotein SlyB